MGRLQPVSCLKERPLILLKMITPSAFLIVLITLLQGSQGYMARNQLLKRSNFQLSIAPTPQSQLLTLTRPGTPGSALTSLNSKEEWKTDCIDTQNYYRNLYRDNNTGEKLKMLKWNSSLAQTAHQWAQHLIRNSKPLSINASYEYGATINEVTYPWRNKLVCSPGIDLYYRQAAKYKQRLSEWKRNPSSGVFSFYRIDGFTQMMWPNTTHVGCAFAKDADRKINVCYYYPR